MQKTRLVLNLTWRPPLWIPRVVLKNTKNNLNRRLCKRQAKVMNNHLEIWYPHNLKNCNYQCDALKYKRLKKINILFLNLFELGSLQACHSANFNIYQMGQVSRFKPNLQVIRENLKKYECKKETIIKTHCNNTNWPRTNYNHVALPIHMKQFGLW